ncbi:3-deoxy-D-manno-octulosonic acid transferase [Pedobacter sandarakinus]|uniref:3-deoxy-D-manno-octulosonic acid transferase n=1 Tax=Pedobacter sandarakinus TaxID=353156 RepID=UPI0022464215|nr:glycosyltransferase N-terminal domain-containing protein [Pedobacter sandarakinus]
MLLLYIIGIRVYTFVIRVFSLFNPKAEQFINGRKNVYTQIVQRINPAEKHIWFHFASLGEFEQGRPVLEQLKTQYPDKQIVITFFSPSGYEIRKNYPLADVFYLPMDSKRNARRFLDLINPEVAIFTKYEFWHFYFKTLKERQIPLYLISGIFRPQQTFFAWYGGFYRNLLTAVSHFFVQNEESEILLKSIGFNNVTRSGDTRFDRVYENAQHPKPLPIIAAFCKDAPVIIAGSTWLPDEKLLVSLAEQHPAWKLIIAPHEIDVLHIRGLEELFPKAVKYSNLEKSSTGNQSQILIIDNIGILSSLYQYGKLAYIGGGFGTGIHNTLEAAAFGLPVIFGPKFDKFQEAKDLISVGAAKSIINEETLIDAFEMFKRNEISSAAARAYVYKQKGATVQILAAIKKAI